MGVHARGSIAGPPGYFRGGRVVSGFAVVTGEQCRVLVQPVGIQLLNRVRDDAVNLDTSLAQQRPVCRLMRQRVLESVGSLGLDYLAQELGAIKLGEQGR